MSGNGNHVRALMDDIYYPRLLRRVQALLIDYMFIAVFFYAIAFLPPMGDWSIVKPMVFVIGIFILEPGLESFTGGTIGHHWLKIRVTRLSGQGNINLVAATARFIVKATLGWFSLIMVMTSRRHQALHDLVARSLVVYRTSEHLPTYEKLVARPSLSEAYVLPPWWRRTSVTLAYFIATYLCSIGMTLWLVSEPCLSDDECSVLDTVVVEVTGIAWMFGACALIVLGWRGQLYGSRRKVRS